jgi:hypothetical protein
MRPPNIPKIDDKNAVLRVARRIIKRVTVPLI